MTTKVQVRARAIASLDGLSTIDISSSGHLGRPIACNTVKLVDVPEFSLSTKESGFGEICVKGTNIFSGYYKDYESYRRQFDEEGRLLIFNIDFDGHFTCSSFLFTTQAGSEPVI